MHYITQPIFILNPHISRSRGSGPGSGLKRVGGGSNLAMSSLSLPPGHKDGDGDGGGHGDDGDDDGDDDGKDDDGDCDDAGDDDNDDDY